MTKPQQIVVTIVVAIVALICGSVLPDFTVAQLAPYVQALAPLLAWITAVVGWFFVSRDNDRRELRKENRQSLGDIRQRVVKIADLCDTYYTSATEISGASIKNEFLALSSDINRLSASSAAYNKSDLLIAFRQTAMGNDFEVAQRKSRTPDDARLLEIRSAGQALVDALETAFTETFGRR